MEPILLAPGLLSGRNRQHLLQQLLPELFQRQAVQQPSRVKVNPVLLFRGRSMKEGISP